MRKSEKFNIGIDARNSMKTKSARAITDRPKGPATHMSCHPAWGISFMAKINRLQVSMSRIAPGKSTETSLIFSLLSSNSRQAKNAPQIPIGRLIKKIQRHPTVSIKNPPRVGPVKKPT